MKNIFKENKKLKEENNKLQKRNIKNARTLRKSYE